MIENLFPAQIWKCSLNVEPSIKSNILKCIEENYKTYNSDIFPSWPCNIHSSYFGYNDIPYEGLIPYFKEQYEKFSRLIDLKNHNYEIFEMWYNYYLKGYNQEYHEHIGNDCMYSAVYFLKLYDDQPKITFYNYTNYHVFYKLNPKIKNIYSDKNINHSITSLFHNLDVKENDFVIFPSYVPHGVFVQKTDMPRITISLNFKVK